MKRRGFFGSIAAALGAIAALPLARAASAAPCTTLVSGANDGWQGQPSGLPNDAYEKWSKVATESFEAAQRSLRRMQELSEMHEASHRTIAEIERQLAQASMSAISVGAACTYRDDGPFPAINFGGQDDPAPSTSA